MERRRGSKISRSELERKLEALYGDPSIPEYVKDALGKAAVIHFDDQNTVSPHGDALTTSDMVEALWHTTRYGEAIAVHETPGGELFIKVYDRDGLCRSFWKPDPGTIGHWLAHQD